MGCYLFVDSPINQDGSGRAIIQSLMLRNPIIYSQRIYLLESF